MGNVVGEDGLENAISHEMLRQVLSPANWGGGRGARSTFGQNSGATLREAGTGEGGQVPLGPCTSHEIQLLAPGDHIPRLTRLSPIRLRLVR